MSDRKTTRNCSRKFQSFLLRFGFLCVALATTAHPQGLKLDAVSVKKSLLRVQQGEFDAGDVHRLAEAGEVQAISALRQQFAAKRETMLKEFIASALIRLGEKDLIYWDYLARNARSAVENDAPSIFLLDSQGNVMPGNGKFSPEFTEWAKAHKLDANSAAQTQLYELPAYVSFLGRTGDHRALPVLRKGLASRNVNIQLEAARGLAKLQDKDSIPSIIDACKKAPAGLDSMIARALVFFDDPRAQSAAEKFIPNKQTLEELRRRSREKGADPFLY